MSRAQKPRQWYVGLIVLVSLPVILVLLPLILIGWASGVALIHLIAWSKAAGRGRYVLFVYSESPIWKEYLEINVLPALTGRVEVLNWSERRLWKFSFPVLVFKLLSGQREFNPLAVVIPTFGRMRRFRFWQAFRDFKHGNPGPLEHVRSELLRAL